MNERTMLTDQDIDDWFVTLATPTNFQSVLYKGRAFEFARAIERAVIERLTDAPSRATGDGEAGAVPSDDDLLRVFQEACEHADRCNQGHSYGRAQALRAVLNRFAAPPAQPEKQAAPTGYIWRRHARDEWHYAAWIPVSDEETAEMRQRGWEVKILTEAAPPAPIQQSGAESAALQKARHDSAHAETERDRIAALAYWLEQQSFEPAMLSCAGATLRALHERISEAPAAQGDERALLYQAMERMDRARSILTNGQPSPECNWGMLDTSALRAALARQKGGGDAEAGKLRAALALLERTASEAWRIGERKTDEWDALAAALGIARGVLKATTAAQPEKQAPQGRPSWLDGGEEAVAMAREDGLLDGVQGDDHE